jgi:putative acetyltransferase
VDGLTIAVDDPRRDDVQALLRVHLAFAHENTPVENIHALPLDGLLDPAITFFTARRGNALVAMGAIKHLDATHAELKSMHTAQAARGQGVGRAFLAHLIGQARERGYRRVSIETGTTEAFAPGRAFYGAARFVPCGPFADYRVTPDNTFMTLALDEL